MKPALKRYLIEFGGAMLLYTATLLFLMPVLLDRLEDQGALVWVAAMLPLIPTVLIVVAIVRFHRSQDEMHQRVMGEVYLIAAMIVIFGSFGYGFLEAYADAPPLPVIFILPAFFALWIPITPIVWKRYR
jgi:hypothetical protein